MMHPHFYHWHGRAEVKPDVAVLEPRWEASIKITKKLSSSDVSSLLRLVLFSESEPEFIKRLSDGLVKAEPTFPPENNLQLVRVMATAAAYHHMENRSVIADAIALGLQAADFPKGILEPVCQDVLNLGATYLTKEAEVVRPKIYVENLAEAERKAEGIFNTLKKAAQSNSAQELGTATEEFGRVTLAAIKESHKHLGDMIGRLAEESQFLWWLVGRWSPSLDCSRARLACSEYALTAAAEAAERVIVLPPALSVESLLEETLKQCGKNGADNIPLSEIVDACNKDWAKRTAGLTGHRLTPVSSLLNGLVKDGKSDVGLLKRFGISTKKKFAASEVARQYFRELMFIKSIQKIG